MSPMFPKLQACICDKYAYQSCEDPTTWTNLTTVDEHPSLMIKGLDANHPYSLKATAFNSAGELICLQTCNY